MTPRRWSAVIFDLDGVLIDSEPYFVEAARRLLARRGVEFDAAWMHAIMGMPARDVLPRFRERFDLDATVDEIGAEYKYFFVESLEGGSVPLLPGAATIVGQLVARQVPLALATSSSRQYVDAVFAPHGLLPHFLHVLTAEDVTHGKPHPEVYRRAAELLGVDPPHALVIEDSANGIRAAKAAGCACLCVGRPSEAADWNVNGLDDPTVRSTLH